MNQMYSYHLLDLYPLLLMHIKASSRDSKKTQGSSTTNSKIINTKCLLKTPKLLPLKTNDNLKFVGLKYLSQTKHPWYRSLFHTLMHYHGIYQEAVLPLTCTTMHHCPFGKL